MRKRTAVTFLTCFLVLSLLLPVSYAQRATEFRIDGNIIKSYIEFMSTDEMEGRKTLTEGFIKAEEWAAAMFKEWGLKPAGENGTYFQNVPIGRGFTWNTGIPEMNVKGRAFFMNDGDFSLGSISTAATTVNAEIVFAGYGISAPGKGLDEYAGIDVGGKIVLVFRGSPKDAPTSRGRFGPAQAQVPEPVEEWTEESTDMAKIQTAYDKGAAAILFYDPDAAAAGATTGRRPTMGDRQQFTPTRNFLSFTITDRVFRTIMKPDPQESTGGLTRRMNSIRVDIKNKKTHSMITGVMANLKGYDTSIQYGEEFGNNIGRNVMAKIEGTDPVLKYEYVIMGGHMDHNGVRNGLVYNGADDNASGTATAMEVGRVLAAGNFQPKRTIIFCCWCGEELGLIGSRYYTSNPCDGVTMDNVVTYFNMDMVGLGDAIGAPGALNFPTIWEVIKRDQDPDVIAAVQPRTGGPGGSDHSGFIEKGIEALALMTSGGGGHPSYHQPEDDTEFIDPEILRKTGQFVIQGAMNLANETQVNLLIEDRQHIFNAMRMSITNFNPELERSSWQYVEIDAINKNALVELMLERALALALQREEQVSPMRAQAALPRAAAQAPSRPRKSVARGIQNLQIFEGDTKLMGSASDLFGFGRVDIKDDDGVWVLGGRLSTMGHDAVKAMEENNIVVHLVSPSQGLINDMLNAASKPFIITGTYTISDAMVSSINEKRVLLGINFDPADVSGCIARLEAAKTQLGDTDNLVLFVTSTDGMDDAKEPFYMGLIKKGWSHAEIVGERDGPPGVAGGALSIFGGGAARRGR